MSLEGDWAVFRRNTSRSISDVNPTSESENQTFYVYVEGTKLPCSIVGFVCDFFLLGCG